MNLKVGQLKYEVMKDSLVNFFLQNDVSGATCFLFRM